jgi:aldehyde:ferredoxin oxidoreductase
MFGYMGRILRVDLSAQRSWTEDLAEDTARKYVGGVALGATYLLGEVLPGVEWSSPENLLIFMTGPLGGSRVSGSGSFCVVSKGPMTNAAASTQANGFFGAFLRFSGYDGLIIQGRAAKPTYLFIHEEGVQFRDASDLMGLGTLKTQETIKSELGLRRKGSVIAIGPAGENRVRYAAIVGDGGHVAAHNGVGAVMGSKNLKAIAAHHSKLRPSVKDPTNLKKKAKELLEDAKEFNNRRFYTWGTNSVFEPALKGGWLPIKNLTTNVLEGYEKLLPEYTRAHFEHKPRPCWACSIAHVKHVRVTEGVYAGLEGEEPEYECVAAWGPLTGNFDPGAVVMLSNLTDDLGLDVNESGWTMAWVLECYEKGILTKKDVDGLEMNWGNVESIREMLHKIAHRNGFGDLLAEGVKRASDRIGGEAIRMAVYTNKGNTLRMHDHRGRWSEIVDNCVSNTGTHMTTFGPLRPEALGDPPVKDHFSTEEIPRVSARVSGWHQFEDCLGVCRFCIKHPLLTVACVKAITGWDIDLEEALTVGRRAINQLRVFDIRHGMKIENERPSHRYGSTPIDGPVSGKGIMPVFDDLARSFYRHMGWDVQTGIPLAKTLHDLALDHLLPYVNF